MALRGSGGSLIVAILSCKGKHKGNGNNEEQARLATSLAELKNSIRGKPLNIT